MIALLIIALVLLILLLMPVGVEAAYVERVFTACAKAGPVKIRVFPRKPKKPKTQKEAAEAQEKDTDKKHAKKKKDKPKLTRQDIADIARLGLKTLKRFRHSLSIDKLMLHLTVASKDPCDTAVLYGQMCMLAGILMPLARQAFTIRDEDIAIGTDYLSEKLSVEAALCATLQIWEIIHIAVCAGIGFLQWKHARKKRTASAAPALEAEKGC